jgi:pteridine reductase
MSTPVALITGAGRRIGAAIAQALHSRGYRVILHYRESATEARELAQSLNSERADSAKCLQADLNAHKQVTQLAQEALTLWDRVDLLVNNASSFYPTPLGTATEQQWNDLMASNLKAPFFLSQALAEALAENEGSIINIADIHGERPMPKHSIYSIAKAGNMMLTKTLAMELAPKVRVNGIAPGAVLWPENAAGGLEEQPHALENIPMQTLGGAESIANAVLYLAQEPSYVTGHILTVDGGRSLRQ